MNIYCSALPEDPNSVLIINIIQFTTAFSSSYRALTPPIRCRHPVSYGPYEQTHTRAQNSTHPFRNKLYSYRIFISKLRENMWEGKLKRKKEKD